MAGKGTNEVFNGWCPSEKLQDSRWHQVCFAVTRQHAVWFQVYETLVKGQYGWNIKQSTDVENSEATLYKVIVVDIGLWQNLCAVQH